ncbi:MAG TPA: hypothetical protein VNF29_12450 [Candidatus Binataceae bacterium]|nr:hypothetical protein [Candidatus Binataceae bacterium]
MFGNVYGIFENEDEPLERMVGGFIVHDLATLPQSYPKPDVSHLPPHQVIEAGELWSLSKGIARFAAVATAIIAGAAQAKAIIVYPIVKPIDRAAFYKQVNFVSACPPVKFPYGETTDGGEIWVQPMILEGAKLEEYIRSGFEFLFKNREGRQVLRFDRPPAAPAGEIQAPKPDEVTVRAAVPEADREDRNGAAPAPAARS